MRPEVGKVRERLSPLVVIAPVVLLSALALGGYSYRFAAQLSDRAERSLIDSNRLLGTQTLERIDNFIVDFDRAMFDLVDMEHLADFQRPWSNIVRVSPAIDEAIVLDENLKILPQGYVSKRKPAYAEAFKTLFETKILPDMPLETLPPDQHRHLHKEYGGREYLLSYIKRERNGRAYYVVLKISLEWLRTVLFPDVLEPLRGKYLYCVRDSHDRVIFGDPVGAPGKYLFEKGFPTTLYEWRLQLAPEPAAMIARQDLARRRSEYLLISLTLGIILAGTVFLLYASARERRANQLKSDFISNVSHELKTPLSLIRMFGELLALGRLKAPEKAKEYADIITREAERLSRLIDNVLDFSRMERGRSAYEFNAGSLADVIERALDVYRHRLEREGFRLVTKIDPELPPVQIDENAMTLLLLNLLENAVKYGAPDDQRKSGPAEGFGPEKKGGAPPEIQVYLTRVGDVLRLVVGDQGPGIPKEEQKRIFDRFYRTRQARQTNARGSGIGLSLVKHIAEAHGGTVTVESEPGHGAAFIVDVPLERRQAAA